MPMPTRRDLPIRISGRQVRRQPIRRASRRVTATQVYALILMILCLAVVIALGNSPSFGARNLEIRGATFTSQETVRQIVGIDHSPNLFRLRSDRIAADLIALPSVQSVSVEVRLPDTIVVTLVEREPKLVWVIGDRRFVVDAGGLLFGQVDAAGNPTQPQPGTEVTPSPEPSPEGTSALPSGTATSDAGGSNGEPTQPSDQTNGRLRFSAGAASTFVTRPEAAKATPTPVPTTTLPPPPSLLPAPTADPNAAPGPGAVAVPVVYDRTAADAGLGLGGYVDPTSLDAGFRLAGLSPADVGSGASGLTVVLDDEHGFTLSSGPDGWVAQFGFYTATLRKDTVIPEQVRTLRSLLIAEGEDHVAWVFLMGDLSDVHINTYIRK
jgi:hypothetical protein